MPKKTLETVLDSGNHLLVQLKGNQPTLQAHARQLTRAGQWVPSHETSLYLCDLPHDTAAMGNLIRRHWHIENRLH